MTKAWPIQIQARIDKEGLPCLTVPRKKLQIGGNISEDSSIVELKDRNSFMLIDETQIEDRQRM